jgi:hypothetical protein
MTTALGGLGVQFVAPPPADTPRPDPKGPAHLPAMHGVWVALAKGLRQFPAGLALSQSAVARLAPGDVVSDRDAVAPAPGAQPGPYRPGNLGGYVIAGAPAPGVQVV